MLSVSSAVAAWSCLTHVAAFQSIQLVPSYVWALGVSLLGLVRDQDLEEVGKLDEIDGRIELERVAHILRQV